MGRPRAGASELNRERIIASALALLKTEGIAGLSISGVARSLNVKPPSIYWYYPNREALESAVAGALFQRSAERIPQDLPAFETIEALGNSLHRILLEHPGSGILVANVTAASTAPVHAFIDLLIAKGVKPSLARSVTVAVQSFALGFALFEGNPSTRAAITEIADSERCFGNALVALAGMQELPGFA